MALPLFAPGGVELGVVLLVSLLLFSPLVALAYIVLFRPGDDTEERVADLEAEVETLRERLDEQADGGDSDASATADAGRPPDADRDDAAGGAPDE